MNPYYLRAAAIVHGLLGESDIQRIARDNDCTPDEAANILFSHLAHHEGR